MNHKENRLGFLWEIIKRCKNLPWWLSIFFAQFGYNPNKAYQALRHFYTKENAKFSNTRKKHRPEFDYILEEIKNYLQAYNLTSINICELWCGDGRFYGYLKDHLEGIVIKYTGVDFSSSFIKQADKDFDSIDTRWLAQDMSAYLKSTKQEQYDMIICIASFQHLFLRQRRPFLQLCYRALKREGQIIMTNWSWSSWFIYRYLASVLWSSIRSLVQFWNYSRGDMLIPFKSDDNKYLRFYHIFTKRQLKRLFRLSWFVIKKVWYTNRDGSWGYDFDNSTNTFLVGKKDIM